MQHSSRDLLNTAISLIKKRDYQGAYDASGALVTHYPDFAPGWGLRCELNLDLRRPEQALQAIQRALQLSPDNKQWHLLHLRCLLEIGRLVEAKSLALDLSQSGFDSHQQAAGLGALLTQLDLHREAIEQYNHAIAMAPVVASNHYNLATAQRFVGDTDEAIESLNRAIALNPKDHEAMGLRSTLRKQGPASNHIDELKHTLGNTDCSPAARTSLCYALAKELDDLEDYEQAFQYLSKGASTRREHIQYDVKTDEDIMAQIAKSFDANFFQRAIDGSNNDEAIFIIGLPRTGTTLVERVLGSHSHVHAAGELNNFTSEMMRQVRTLCGNQKPSRLGLVEKTRELNFKNLGEAYINSTRPLTGHTPRFIDKLPFNFLYAGLIHTAMPKAKIISLRRNPMDSCFSIYKQLFRDAYPFSYDLNDMGRYYLAYRRLMEHWKQVMPGVIYELNYEDVVADLEGQAQKLVAFCGLNWEDNCVRFHENKAASTTASASQVRQPVYSSSVAKWAHYRTHLEPLAEVLRAGGVVIE